VYIAVAGSRQQNNMKKNHSLSFILTFSVCAMVSNAQKPDPKYFNEPPPGTTPAVFAPGKVSTTNQFEFGAVFSKDRNEFYYGVEISGKAETRLMKYANGKWTSPEAILIHPVYSFNDPFLTPDETKLFFISDRALDGRGPKKDYDIWYVERQAGKWSEPINAGKNINSEKNEYYISFTKEGKMYFSSNTGDKEGKNNFDIYSSDYRSNAFAPAIKLPAAVNSPHYEADVFVAPDESYLVFAANRPGGLGSGDLYVSFREPDGKWSDSRSLGNIINTETDDFCPYVSPDGKYLFYASRGDVYWVSTEVVRRLR
jgi:Tol biopolymer transport system component